MMPINGWNWRFTLLRSCSSPGRSACFPTTRPIPRLYLARPGVARWKNSPTGCSGVDATKESRQTLCLRDADFQPRELSVYLCDPAILQNVLPLYSSQHFGALSLHLAFNTAVSFTTNTNWQSYGGESTTSHLAQMVALAIHNFFSAAVGIAIAAALVRGIARHTAQTIGNFLVPRTRIPDDLLLPICLVLALFLCRRACDKISSLTCGLIAVTDRFRSENRRERQTDGRRQRGNPVMVNQTLDTQTIVIGADGFAYCHQDALWF